MLEDSPKELFLQSFLRYSNNSVTPLHLTTFISRIAAARTHDSAPNAY